MQQLTTSTSSFHYEWNNLREYSSAALQRSRYYKFTKNLPVELRDIYAYLKNQTVPQKRLPSVGRVYSSRSLMACAMANKSENDGSSHWLQYAHTAEQVIIPPKPDAGILCSCGVRLSRSITFTINLTALIFVPAHTEGSFPVRSRHRHY